uniref:Uncharacterized protein n=1 Tax=Manihot esculenta TaxID=3983 RepID=A0A2C9V526_MANES
MSSCWFLQFGFVGVFLLLINVYELECEISKFAMNASFDSSPSISSLSKYQLLLSKSLNY